MWPQRTHAIITLIIVAINTGEKIVTFTKTMTHAEEKCTLNNTGLSSDLDTIMFLRFHPDYFTYVGKRDGHNM
jgi:hypothetical protein